MNTKILRLQPLCPEFCLPTFRRLAGMEVFDFCLPVERTIKQGERIVAGLGFASDDLSECYVEVDVAEEAANRYGIQLLPFCGYCDYTRVRQDGEWSILLGRTDDKPEDIMLPAGLKIASFQLSADNIQEFSFFLEEKAMKELSKEEVERFVLLVQQMRTSQKDYFSQRTKSALERSKKLEREVDTAIQNIFYPQQNLFN